MYFIEHFLDMASKDGQEDYIRMMQRDIIRVVDAVAPDDGSGAANVKVVRKVCVFAFLTRLYPPNPQPMLKTQHKHTIGPPSPPRQILSRRHHPNRHL